MRQLSLFLSLIPVAAGFVSRLVVLGTQHAHYADHYARFFRIPLLRPETYIAPKHYVVVADRAEDLGYLWEEEDLVVVDMDKFLCASGVPPDGNHFISWVLQHYT